MEKSNSVKILEVCKITPCKSNSSNISLPLTSFDWLFMNILPTKRLFYYKLTDSDPPFLDSIIPKLKKSLSLTLQHFLPVSGNLVWPENSPKPFILYTPNDSVSFIVAEIHDSDFNHLSGNHPQEIRHSQILIPSMESSDLKTPLMAIQVTKFPNHDGFSIGVSCHHVIFDGKSVSLFMKAWSHICKLNQYPLPESLTPSFDRNPSSDFIPKDKFSLKLVAESSKNNFDSNLFYGTFELTHSNIEKLKKRVLLEYSSIEEENLHLSSFVVAYAYSLMCLVKAKKEENEGNYFLMVLTADIRDKVLDPSLSSNYFGNCLGFTHGLVQGREFADDENNNNAFPNIAKKVSDLVLGLKNDGRNLFMPHKPHHEVEDTTTSSLGGVYKLCSIASSPKLRFYDTDFGFGKPEKIEFVSLGDYNISITETRDGGYGDIEIGIVLPRNEMDDFASLFSYGLN